MNKILDGIKVLDFTQALAGPFCTMYLADLGADVIKIERNHTGEQSRCWGPFNNDYSAYFAAFNRNKRSIGVDLTSPKGKEIILNLVKESDIVIENFKVGTLEKLGLGYEEMKKVNPQLIYASISGFGIEGPLSKYACYDIIACARSGILDRTGEEGESPIKAGFSLGDNWSGLNLLYGISMALLNKQATGKGTRLDVAMLDSAFYMMEMPVLENSITGNVTPRNGNHDTRFAPSGIFEARDGFVSVVCIDDNQWISLCNILGLNYLKDSELYSSNEKRLENLNSLIIEIENVTKLYSKYEIENILVSNQVPAGAVRQIKEVMEDPKMINSKMVVESSHKILGKLHLMGVPMKFHKTPADITKSQAPIVGEHTLEVLLELGYTSEYINNLQVDGIVCDNDKVVVLNA
ncbi:CaiB/BaiF CoA transferase family protein [Clostridium sp.]|uniref:CaiB/BaiF CoA transferase family protein n=1 Tax=Clostridium sp. TaxID=1506 RepID=UPI003F3FD1FF